MTDLERLSAMDFESAYRIARARGMAERSRVMRSILGGLAGAVRDLFSRPETERRCCQE